MAPEVLLFTKPECEKCDYVKEKIPNNLNIKILDMTTPDGMAHAAFYELLERYTPILVVDDEIVEGALRIKKRMKELMNAKQ
jgi:hypothetical protein